MRRANECLSQHPHRTGWRSLILGVAEWDPCGPVNQAYIALPWSFMAEKNGVLWWWYVVGSPSDSSVWKGPVLINMTMWPVFHRQRSSDKFVKILCCAIHSPPQSILLGSLPGNQSRLHLEEAYTQPPHTEPQADEASTVARETVHQEEGGFPDHQ